MTWTAVSTTNFSGNVGAGGAGSTLQNGWIDQAGSTWSIVSSKAVSAYFALGSGPNHMLIRPSSESAIDSQISCTFTYEDGTDGPILYVRASGTPGSTFQAYAAIIIGGGVLLGTITNGSFGASSDTVTYPLTVGHSYTAVMACVQTNGTTTAVAIQITDNTGGGGVGPTGYNDTTPAMQNAVGVCAIQANRSSSGASQDLFAQLITYTDAVTATALTATAPASGSPGSASGAIVLQSNGILATSVTGFPSDNGAGGTFSPASVVLAAGTDTSGSCSYTPAAGVDGVKITCTNNGGLANPPPLYYTAPSLTVVSNGTVSGGPTSPGAAGSVVWNGWIDELGGCFIDSSQRLQIPYNGAAYLLQVIQRPPQEATVDLKGAVTFYVADTSANATTIFFWARRSVNAKGQVSGYAIGCGPAGSLSISAFVNGALVASVASIATGAFVAGHSLTLTPTIVQCPGGVTQIIASLYDNTAPGSLGTVVGTDSTAALQSVAGVATISQNQASSGSASNPITALETWTDLGVASSYAASGPNTAAPGVASAPIYLAAQGSLGAAKTVNLSDNGAGGTFKTLGGTVITSVTLSSGAFPQYSALTYTPLTVGNKTLSFTCAGLTNPPPLVLQVYNLTTVTVDNPAFLFNPVSWKGDTGRGGSAWRQSLWNGNYFTFQWTASAFPVANLLVNVANQSSSNMLTIAMNNQWTGNIAATGSIDLTQLTGFLPGQPNTCVVYLQTSTSQYRWNNGVNTVRITGMQIDSTSIAGVAAPNPPQSPVPSIGYFTIYSDSLGEGAYADNGTANALCSWTFFVAQQLAADGYDMANMSCSNDGWLESGDIGFDVPPMLSVTNGVQNLANSRIYLADAGVDIRDANGLISAYGALNTPPTGILLNLGTNEAFYALSVSDMQTSILGSLLRLRAAAPLARIYLCIPFSIQCTLTTCTFQFDPAYTTVFHSAFAAYQAINPADARVYLLDLGQPLALRLESNGSPLQYQATSHWLTRGHAEIAPAVYEFIKGTLAAPITPVAPPEYQGKSASAYG